MKLLAVLVLLFSSFKLYAQNLEQIVEKYIHEKNVITISEKDSSYHKTGKPYLKKYASGIKSLTVPKGAITIPMPTGINDVRGKFYSSIVPQNVILTLYIVWYINDKEVVNAVNGGDIAKDNRTSISILVDFNDYQKTTIYCYLLNGVVFGAPFAISKDCVVKMCNFSIGDFTLNKDIPALLIYEEEKYCTKKERLINKMKSGQVLDSNNFKYMDFYKQLGNYCIIYYRFTKKNEK